MKHYYFSVEARDAAEGGKDITLHGELLGDQKMAGAACEGLGRLAAEILVKEVED